MEATGACASPPSLLGSQSLTQQGAEAVSLNALAILPGSSTIAVSWSCCTAPFLVCALSPISPCAMRRGAAAGSQTDAQGWRWLRCCSRSKQQQQPLPQAWPAQSGGARLRLQQPPLLSPLFREGWTNKDQDMRGLFLDERERCFTGAVHANAHHKTWLKGINVLEDA